MFYKIETEEVKHRKTITAYHEAGHIVAALASGGEVIKATISPGHGRAAGRVYHKGSRAIAVIVGWAGSLAVGWLEQGKPWEELIKRASDNDTQFVNEFPEQEGVALFLAAIMAVMLNLLAIRFFADALLQRGTLIDTEIKALARGVKLFPLSCEVLEAYVNFLECNGADVGKLRELPSVYGKVMLSSWFK